MNDLDERLFQACRSRNVDNARRLIESGANVNYGEVYGWTTLHGAVDVGDVGIVQLLLSKGADTGLTSPMHRTALHVAASAGNLELVKLLLQYGADSTVQGIYGRTAEDV